MRRIIRIAGFFLAAVLACSVTACAGKPDVDVLMREARTNANAIQNCSATISNELVFSANGKENHCQTGNQLVYWAKPFAIKATQTSLLGGKTDSSVSYTVTDAKGMWFYSESGGTWQKTSAGNIDTTPLAQVDILRLLGSVKSQKYVREETLNSKKVQKVELTFQNEVLRNTIETIVTATNMGQGSKTIVQTLLDSADDVYGYCYVDETSGEIVRIEFDATEAVNHIFKNIDGSGITINVSKCKISGDITNIGKTPAVELPPQAAAAQAVEAAG